MRSRRASWYFLEEKYTWIEEEKRREKAEKSQGTENPPTQPKEEGKPEKETEGRLE